jgi:hypothetical protein
MKNSKNKSRKSLKMLSQVDVNRIKVLAGEVFNYGYGTYRYNSEKGYVEVVNGNVGNSHHANVDKVVEGGLMVYTTVIGQIFTGKIKFSEVECF